jgi:threonine/homoserine/homoserine lactone efflux protein
MIFALLLLELTPGPNMAYLAAPRSRLARNSRSAAGVAIHVVIAAFGLGDSQGAADNNIA